MILGGYPSGSNEDANKIHNDHTVEWDDEENCFVEHVPECELPQCMEDPPRHRYAQPLTDRIKVCILCGIAELVTGDGHTRA